MVYRGPSLLSLGALTASLFGCPANEPGVQRPAYTEEREPCSDFNPRRNLYFGDLHAHSVYSFDAVMWHQHRLPGEAYAFARGGRLELPPSDEEGARGRPVKLDRPLDFAAVVDHAELLAETVACTTPWSAVYDTRSCETFRDEEGLSYVFGMGTIKRDPVRHEDICGAGGIDCLADARKVWGKIRDAAQKAYDRGPSCTFSTFVGYEYTANTDITNTHRIVIFRNNTVPELPPSYFEQPTLKGLMDELQTTCLDGGNGCDVMMLPHNSNLSNGTMFNAGAPEGISLDRERELARQRARLDLTVEVFQHKGDSECINGLTGLSGDDPHCEFEKLRRPPHGDCGDGTGSLGMMGKGCVSRYDYARNALLLGLKEEQRLGVNPYKLGLIASTDTHNATPGFAYEDRYEGHSGSKEDTPEERLGPGGYTPKGVLANPGGLTGVWAVENSRDGLFEAFRRREVFGTSGPRIAVRFFGGWDLPDDMCSDPAGAVEAGYEGGVPMGGDLPKMPGGATAPRFHVSARRAPATPLQRIQIIKGWIAGGAERFEVFEVAGEPNNGASVDLETCERTGEGFETLCAVWTDPKFNPDEPAFYYVRVLENPTCRWSTRECNRLEEAERPEVCRDPGLPKIIQERAWSSPIWYSPPSPGG